MLLANVLLCCCLSEQNERRKKAIRKREREKIEKKRNPQVLYQKLAAYLNPTDQLFAVAFRNNKQSLEAREIMSATQLSSWYIIECAKQRNMHQHELQSLLDTRHEAAENCRSNRCLREPPKAEPFAQLMLLVRFYFICFKMSRETQHNPEPMCHWKLGQHETNKKIYFQDYRRTRFFFGGYFSINIFFCCCLSSLYFEMCLEGKIAITITTTTTTVSRLLAFFFLSRSIFILYFFLFVWSVFLHFLLLVAFLWNRNYNNREEGEKFVTFGSRSERRFCVCKLSRCHRARLGS